MAVHRRTDPPTLAGKATDHIVRIVHQDEVFHLSRPIDLELAWESRLCGCEYPPLRIIAYGVSEEDALKDFASHFAHIWHEIASEPDSALTPGAQKLKTAIKDLVTSVERR